MVATLPRNIQLKLQQTLAQWQHWRCALPLSEKPTVVRLLSPGMSNYSILVESPSHAPSSRSHYVVRLDGLNPATAGLSRQAEWRALSSASAADLAPCPRYYNPELGALVYDYLEADAERSAGINAVATLLRGIHELPPLHFRLDLQERILRYEKHIEHSRRALHPTLKNCRQKILSLIEHSGRSSDSSVLCHNDLLQANRIASPDGLRAIDWEYCAMGSRWFDLAVVCAGDALSEDESELLLNSYLGREADAAERLQLKRKLCIYRYLELLWFSALDDPAEREKQVTGWRLENLEESLVGFPDSKHLWDD